MAVAQVMSTIKDAIANVKATEAALIEASAVYIQAKNNVAKAFETLRVACSIYNTGDVLDVEGTLYRIDRDSYNAVSLYIVDPIKVV